MKIYSTDTAPIIPVSHDPGLKKRLLAGPEEGISCIRHLSHILLRPGDSASEHSHRDAFEVFYCLRGSIVFSIGGMDVELTKGVCLVVEPEEPHAIARCIEESELFYFLVSK